MLPTSPAPIATPGNGRSIFAVYVLTFFVLLHTALPSYINSSFISQFIGEERVGMLYIVGALLSLLLIAYLPQILSSIGNYWTSIVLTILQVGLSIAIAIFDSPYVVIPFFVVSLAFIRLISLTNDIFLEHHSKDSVTGSIRGVYLAVGNAGWVVAAMSAGLIAEWGGYQAVYIATAIALAPAIYVLWATFRNFEDPVYNVTPVLPTLARLSKDKNLWNITLANLLLHSFFAVMVVYTPLYLHDHLGFDWKTLGLMFGIMLIPYLLVEIPAGKVADKKLGEKELLVVGFVIMGVASALMTGITTASFFLWLAVLFSSRIGAALGEVMSESYFFKHISAADTHVLNIFRSMQHLAYIIAPAVATIFLAFFDFRFLFLALGAAMFLGLYFILKLVDTK